MLKNFPFGLPNVYKFAWSVAAQDMKKRSIVPFRPIPEYVFLDDFCFTAGLENPCGLFTLGSLLKGMYGVYMRN
jgi:hypothetical protein